jgi:membrane-bound serine protease (ClpP class)
LESTSGVKRVHKHEPILAFRVDAQGDWNNLRFGEEPCHERKHRVNSVLFCEQGRFRDLWTPCKEGVDRGFVARHVTEDRLEGSARCRKRQPRAPEMIGREQDDPLVGPARGAAEAAAKAMSFDQAVAAIQKQSDEFALLSGWTDADFRGEIEMFGSKSSRGLLLVTFVLNGYAAYRIGLPAKPSKPKSFSGGSSSVSSVALLRVEPDWRSRLLAVITDPNVAFILLMVGIYGLIFEFSTPGAIAPGVVGTICLLLGLYALNMLPINYAGLALMLLGITFLVVETFNPTVVLGLGGVVAFLLGAAMLFRIEAPGYRLSWTVIIIAAAMIFSLTVLVLGSLWRARSNPPRVGVQAMRGLPAEVLDWSGSEGHVFTNGERWQAHGAEVLAPGETVEVAGIKDLTLVVRRRSARTVSEGGV